MSNTIVKTNLNNLKYPLNLIEIKENKDWQQLKDFTKEHKIYSFIEYSNYFAQRAAENGSCGVIVDVMNIENLIRSVKDVTKYDSKYIAYFNIDNFPMHLKQDTKTLLNELNKFIMEIEIISKEIGIAFKYSDKYEWEDIFYVLGSMYNYPLYLEGFPESFEAEYKIK